MTPEMAPEMETLRARQKATWMAGDYGTFAEYLERTSPTAMGRGSCLLLLERVGEGLARMEKVWADRG